MAFFIKFLKTSGKHDEWVEDCPLRYKSLNAPENRDVVGTILLSVLSGHWRDVHILRMERLCVRLGPKPGRPCSAYRSVRWSVDSFRYLR